MFKFEDSVGSIINTIARLLSHEFNALLQEEGISIGQWPVLMHLWESDGQTQSELCKKIAIEQPTLVRTLDRMERDQLIRRMPNKEDRRKTHFYLTKKAINLRSSLTAKAEIVNNKATNNLSGKQLSDFKKTLLIVLRNMNV